MVTTTLPTLGVAAVLVFVARPIAVWLCLAPFRFRANEVWFISWVGLRGAVPIVLAIFPLIAGAPQAMLLLNVAFAVVLASLLLQGTTIGQAAHKFRVALPSLANESAARAVFGDFSLDANAPIGSICSFFGLPMPAQADKPVGEWLISGRRRHDRHRQRDAQRAVDGGAPHHRGRPQPRSPRRPLMPPSCGVGSKRVSRSSAAAALPCAAGP